MNAALVPFVRRLTGIATAARPRSSTSFVSEHIRGDTVLKSVTLETMGKRNKCSVEQMWSCKKGGFFSLVALWLLKSILGQ